MAGMVATGLVVLELFTAANGAFAPQATRLFDDLARTPGVIALTCPVDYMSGIPGICNARQGWYDSLRHVGLPYTPELMIQGEHDVVAYKLPAVLPVLKEAQDSGGAVPLTIKALGGSGLYNVNAPAEFAVPVGAVLWLLEVAAPGMTVVGVHAVQDSVNGVVAEKLPAVATGFVLLLQDGGSGRVLAAGVFK